MKNNVYIVVILLSLFIGCNSSKPTVSNLEKNLSFEKDTIQINQKPIRISDDTIRIANDTLEYEVIIIDPGFSSWLLSRAYPRNYHSLTYLENKNQIYVNEWNRRVLEPMRYNPNLYSMSIDYSWNIHYGYEVNYLIYNYMIYFQNTFKQRLNGYVPTR